MTIEKEIHEVRNVAESVKNDETQRFPEAASPGDGVRQGDVLLVLLDRVPKGAEPMKVESQLAPGTTQGSRHCLASLSGVRMFRLKDAGTLDGPVIELADENTVTHPEHGDWVLPPGVYAVRYQRDLDELERERRVQD